MMTCRQCGAKPFTVGEALMARQNTTWSCDVCFEEDCAKQRAMREAEADIWLALFGKRAPWQSAIS